MRPTLFGCTSARLSVFTGLPLLRRHRNRCFADPLFLPCQKKWAKRGAWRRSGLYRSATEVPRRRTLRPAHDKLFTKLRYSAACVETTLPSGAVATRGDGKTRCHAIQKHIYVCASGAEYLRSIVHVCRADGERSRQRRRSATDAAYPLRVHIGPFGNRRIRRRFPLKWYILRGPMWASAPTRCCA